MPMVPNRVLLVTPHPDDAEGGCGATVAGWIDGGAEVVYLLCTNGDKGTTDLEMTPPRLAETREREQLEAARVLGVKDVVFLRHPDGALEDDRRFREEVVREIRRHRPDVVMCMDPFRLVSHSHRDHRISGQVTVDAVATYAWRPLHFPEHMADEGLRPHEVPHVYMWGSEAPDTFVDVSATVDRKIETLLKHASQMTDPDRVRVRVRESARRVAQTHGTGFEYAEAFRVMSFSRDPLLVA